MPSTWPSEPGPAGSPKAWPLLWTPIMPCAQSGPTLCSPRTLQPSRLQCPCNPPGKNTGVGKHSLLQRIFLTRGLDPGLLHCRRILHHLSHKGSPRLRQAQEGEVCLPWEPPLRARTHPDLHDSEALRSRAAWSHGTGWCK